MVLFDFHLNDWLRRRSFIIYCNYTNYNRGNSFLLCLLDILMSNKLFVNTVASWYLQNLLWLFYSISSSCRLPKSLKLVCYFIPSHHFVNTQYLHNFLLLLYSSSSICRFTISSQLYSSSSICRFTISSQLFICYYILAHQYVASQYLHNFLFIIF